ncbi:3-phenylpropionate/cinnamic acid dioxygenase ferredoxin--NAD(+) reductase component [Serratia odorifera]|uniref:3-phenylpropionate/cinnamic acid dioxygenase ferredoxin--NAD(+) reductase component n=1 Tax=Serratia odorifera TaxID=618 RepID=A0A3S4EAP9_SEROD|nr:3-phenylpropionate/cinnamic acid dioxygenase ferredoxin--NAD(+) reductase component [Serratia odorifera]
MSPIPDAGMVIVGGGQAGGWAAKTLRDRGYTGRLSVVSDEPYDFYERPPLSKAALLDANAPLSRLFSESAVAALNIDWYRPLRAEQIDAQAQTVTLSDGRRLRFTQLLIATGGRPRLPDARWAAQPQVMTLRSWDDAARLRQALQQSRRLAIVGGGWIGLEIAASARKLGVEVTVFERQPALCMRSVGAEVSQALLELHQQQGVTLHCDCGEITLAQRDGAAWLGSAVSAQQPFDLVVVGIGVELNLELARSAGLQIEGGIVVDGQGRTSHPAIFAPATWRAIRRLACVCSRGPMHKTRRSAPPAPCWMPPPRLTTTWPGCGRINTTPIFRSLACQPAGCIRWCAARRSRSCFLP